MRLQEICMRILDEKNLLKDKRFAVRLKWELEEIYAKNCEDYFLDLYDQKIKYSYNENNLLVCWLLGIAEDYDIEKQPNSVFTGDLPDCDVDYIEEIRDYIKNVWAPATFGSEYVCNIGNYTTYGLKSALLDAGRVHGVPHGETQSITKKLQLRDDDGEQLTWDSAVRIYPEFKEYVEKYPDVAKAAQKFLNRNKSKGVHAAGIIISKSPLSNLVPLVKDEDSPQASAWVEGLHGQDLQPVGLIKFDLLIINLKAIAFCCEIVKKRKNLDGICNRLGMSDWTDVPAWRNNSAAIAMANEGDLKCVFQFDSSGMRNLVKRGGVDSFEDLVAYTALYRPGCLAMKMDERYIERKRGREQFAIHPLIQPILKNTYGVMVYQEQIMKILNVIGNIPLQDCEIVRKAISKKRIEKIIKYKEMFIQNGQKNLNCQEDEINQLWNQVEAFSEYGFNKSHSVSYTYISAWGLYLKANYPLEFYFSVLRFEKNVDKIQEYRTEARLHGFPIERLDINKSGVKFELINDKIYYGLSTVKGIGEAIAQKIVDNQPYYSFEDFLTRFGTTASVVKAVIGLRCFNDADPVTLWKFAEHFKFCAKKLENKKIKFVELMDKFEKEFKKILPDETRTLNDLDCGVENPFDLGDWRKIYDIDQEIFVKKERKCQPNDEDAVEKILVRNVLDTDGVYVQTEQLKYFRKTDVKKIWNTWKELRKIWQKRRTCVKRYKDLEKEALPKILEFDASKYEIDEELEKTLNDAVECEKIYFGFPWFHEVEMSPNYTGKTFEELRNDYVVSGPVEIIIRRIDIGKTKKGDDFYKITVEDANSEQNRVMVWSDDYKRFSEELFVGNLLRMRLQPPTNGFATYILESNQKGKYRGQLKYVNKSDDIRIVVMHKKNKEKVENKNILDEFT